VKPRAARALIAIAQAALRIGQLVTRLRGEHSKPPAHQIAPSRHPPRDRVTVQSSGFLLSILSDRADAAAGACFNTRGARLCQTHWDPQPCPTMVNALLTENDRSALPELPLTVPVRLNV
jgi:hypothetical protein